MRTKINNYIKNGWSFFEDIIPDSELPNYEELLINEHTPILESDQIRSIYGFHHQNQFSEWLKKQLFIKNELEVILDSEVYVYQSKVNVKNTLDESVWPYHRDFPFWKFFDGYEKNEMVNVVIFLDDVSIEEGPLKLLTSSHTVFLPREIDDATTSFSIDKSSSAELAFAFTEEEIKNFKKNHDEYMVVGKKGSVLFFNPDIIHGSGISTSDGSRKLLILTFNKSSNKPAKISERPDFLCSKNIEPIEWNS